MTRTKLFCLVLGARWLLCIDWRLGLCAILITWARS